MMIENGSAFDYAKGKIFVKLGLFLLCCIAAVILMAATIENISIVLFPALLSFIPVGIGIYYAILFRRKKIKGTVCRIVDKKKDIVGGIVSGTFFNRNRYYFTYVSEDGEENTFCISRGGLLNPFTVGQTCLVLHRENRELSADNFIECVNVKENDA